MLQNALFSTPKSPFLLKMQCVLNSAQVTVHVLHECLCEVELQFTEWSFVRCTDATLIESPKGPSNWTTPSRCTPGKVENLV